MLSRIRFSCSLAAADGPWEETTDEAEKTSLRTLSRFEKARAWTSWKPSIWTFSRMARIVFFNIQALRASLQVRRFAKMQLMMCWCFQVFHQTQFSKWNSGFCSFLLKTSSPKKEKTDFLSENRLFSPATAPARIKTFKNTKYLQILGGQHPTHALCTMCIESYKPMLYKCFGQGMIERR